MREYRTTIVPDCLCHDPKATTTHLTTRCDECALLTMGGQVCPKCKMRRSPNCFGEGNRTCSVCRAYNRQHHREHYKERNPKDVARNYGMSVEEYVALQEAQGGLCSICGKPQDQIRDGKPVALHVDHSHVTGQIRGLLCRRCNYIIGWMEQHDWPTLVRAWEHITGEKVPA